MDAILRAILDDDRAKVHKLVTGDSSLVVQCVTEARLYDTKIFHWLYVGDTALHLAAAGYRVEIAGLLLAAGADPNAAMNHRQAAHFTMRRMAATSSDRRGTRSGKPKP